jgi:restriction endonuclease
MKPGEAYGDVDAFAVQRQMIRRTIKEHLDKELRPRPQGIKVLSLFFIDEVAKYRSYDSDGNSVKGDYARIFEEEYRRAVLVEHDGEERIYFVIETKSSLFTDDLRDKESAKIECGKAHFKALSIGETPARYVVARSLDDVLNRV